MLPAESPFRLAPVPAIDPDLDLLGDLRSSLTQRIERLNSQCDDAAEQVAYYSGRRTAFQRQLDAAHKALNQLQNA
jgi:hypothetical protein